MLLVFYRFGILRKKKKNEDYLMYTDFADAFRLKFDWLFHNANAIMRNVTPVFLHYG